MSYRPQIDSAVGDPQTSSGFSSPVLEAFPQFDHTSPVNPSVSKPSQSLTTKTKGLKFRINKMQSSAVAGNMVVDEHQPLLNDAVPKKKPFYRARPLWLVPFVILGASARAMTLAPRVEVYTQLSCNRLYGHPMHNRTTEVETFVVAPHITNKAFYASLDPLGPDLHPFASNYSMPLQFQPITSDDDDTSDPRRLPSEHCVSDSNVQAGAAQLQTIMTVTMGLLSALTTGWWGHFGERYGRTKVLATATLGLFLTDLIFILVSTPSSPLSHHGHKLLLVAPVIEGLLGGWSTVHSATSSYISDCTSSGSRAQIFSRFSGVLYIGFSVGPTLGGWFIRHPITFLSGGKSLVRTEAVTSVFWVAIFSSFINLLLALFIFPESLSQERREAAKLEYSGKGGKRRSRFTVDGNMADDNSVEEAEQINQGVIKKFLKPLAVFLPVVVMDPNGMRKRRDWSLTILGATLFLYHLATGVFQIKYLYAEHTYQWSAEQLSYYISWVGFLRAVFLLFLLPSFIAAFKPQPQSPKGKMKTKNSNKNSASDIGQLNGGKKPKPTYSQLGQAISFDILLARCSIFLDMFANVLVTISPAPSHGIISNNSHHDIGIPQLTHKQSQAMFVAMSSISSMGSGVVPAIQSMALCILQARVLKSETSTGSNEGDNEESESGDKVATGTLFGALAVLQAVGSAIISPMLFGLVYSTTVGTYPKTIFVVAAAILFCAAMLTMLARNPVVIPAQPATVRVGKKKKGKEPERGRSRARKDLRGGATRYNTSGSYGSIDTSSPREVEEGSGSSSGGLGAA